MKIGIAPITPVSIAPSNAKKLVIFDGNQKICDVKIDNMRLPELEDKLYSFGLLSDIHCNKIAGDTNVSEFDAALTFFEEQGCAFCCHSGDMTNVGFYFESTGVYTTDQFGEYKRICDSHKNLPVYGVCGNHESYVRPITENLADLEEYTGHGLHYMVNYAGDRFIFIGQPSATVPMTDEALGWLETMLEENKDRRCFVFVHSMVDASDSGDPYDLYVNDIFDWWNKKTTFINLLRRYEKTILFHGHSHVSFEVQQQVKNVIYSDVLGFHSFHVPSTAYLRNLVDGALVNENGCQGYLVEVYENHILLQGYDFTTNDALPLALYCVPMQMGEFEPIVPDEPEPEEPTIPSGYTIAEYVEATTKNQWLDTGIKALIASNTYKIVTDIVWTDTSRMSIMGCSTAAGHYFGAQGTTYTLGGGKTLSVNPKERRVIEAVHSSSGVTLTANGKSVTRSASVGNSDNFYMFNPRLTPDNYYCKAKVYSYKMYQGETLVRDYIPCIKDSTSEKGFYDFVSKTFFGSSGTEQFV